MYWLGMMKLTRYSPCPISAVTGLVIAIFWLSLPPWRISRVTGEVMATLEEEGAEEPAASGAMFLPKMKPAIYMFVVVGWVWGRGVGRLFSACSAQSPG